ncbi:MAG: exonuclease SbcCD subunit D C-terminal domain-containing protein, partial [Cruoricaptor ignavus]|nr:exonuclease SbcCD subunit D C-terminal domain-containing protein [Cruoricaptor ignavus]
EIPIFQKMESIRGDKSVLFERLKELKQSGDSVWVEIIYTGEEIFPDFATWVHQQTANTKIEILKLQNRQYLNNVLTTNDTIDLLDELNALDVFDKLLEKTDISDEQKQELKMPYKEIVDRLYMEDNAL